MAPTSGTRTVLCCLYVILTCTVLMKPREVDAQYAKIKNNGYYDVVVAIHEDLPEDQTLIDRIKEKFTSASAYLHRATRQRAYFANITILIPDTWQDKPEYKPASVEKFNKADIRVDKPNPALPDNPYVWNGGAACSPGQYMHLTKKYIKDEAFAVNSFGDYDRVLVHEWAHLRWGVKDEYPLGLQSHFYANDNGQIEPVRCSLTVRGHPTGEAVIRTAGGTFRACNLDPNTGLYESGCVFRADFASPSTASLMYYHYLTNMNQFCDDNESSPNSFHNTFAPNRHNNICEGKSIWDVIASHADFRNGANPPKAVANTKPAFKLVRSKSLQVVMILDVSGSMKGTKLEKLRRAARNYIENSLALNSSLAIVTFSNTATLRLPLTKVTDSNRAMMTNRLPTGVTGATSIGAGLRTGLTALSSDFRKREGAVIILITDGQENRNPRIASIQPDLLRSKVTVHTIAISSSAQPTLEDLSDKTGGDAFFDPASKSSRVLEEAFDAIAMKSQQKRVPIHIQGRSVELRSLSSLNVSVNIDKYAGKRLQFVSSYETRPVILTVTSPSGVVYSRKSKGYVENTAFKSVTVNVNVTTGETGEWKVQIHNPDRRNQSIIFDTRTIAELGQQGTEEPIRALAKLSQSTLRYPGYINIIVTLTQGYTPVGGANATAIITTPSNKEVTQELRDDGSGIDAVKGDGVYSGRMTQFDKNGRYSVDIQVSNKGKSAYLSMEGVEGAPLRDFEASTVTKPNIPINDNFEREVLAGSFSLSQYDPRNIIDRFPPSDVKDLQVESLSYDRQTVTLSLTAPGDDFDMGKAAGYDIRMGRSFKGLHTGFENATQVTQKDLISGNLTDPSAGGTIERFTIQVPDRGDRIVFVFGVRAFDEAGNYAKRSNLVSANLQYIPRKTSSSFNLLLVIIIVAVAVVLTLSIIIILSVFCIRRKFGGSAGKV